MTPNNGDHKDFTEALRQKWLDYAVSYQMPYKIALSLFDATFITGKSAGRQQTMKLVEQYGYPEVIEVMEILRKAEAAAEGFDVGD